MRIAKGVAALTLAAAFAAACTSGGASPSTAASVAPTASASAAPVASASPTSDACAPDTLALRTPGKLTIGADNPAYSPFFESSDTNPDEWDLGDPTNGQGFESAVGFAIADEMGFTGDQVTWIPVLFNNAIQPGPKDFDIYLSQASYTAERAKAVDMSDGYYDVAQAVVALKDSKLAGATTIAALKEFRFGAQVGTTSLRAIENVAAPTTEAAIYDSNDIAIEALKSGQIDGLVVDLPTAFYVTSAQVDDGVIVGQFPTPEGGEHYSAVLDLDSPLTECVNAAIGRLKDSGKLAAITQEWLADKADAPVFQP